MRVRCGYCNTDLKKQTCSVEIDDVTFFLGKLVGMFCEGHHFTPSGATWFDGWLRDTLAESL